MVVGSSGGGNSDSKFRGWRYWLDCVIKLKWGVDSGIEQCLQLQLW